MGIYFNPGNSGFAEINDSDYVDKSILIACVNKKIGKKDKLICVSRPRRFGKSFAAKMLAAYYDCSCDSRSLFEGLEISKTDCFEQYLNQYNVIYLDIAGFISAAQRQEIPLRDVPNMIVNNLFTELLSLDPSLPSKNSFTECLIRSVEKQNGRKYIFIIDEWDAVIREAADDDTAQKRYLDLLLEWFKNANFTPRAVAAAYMTGILPIKKDGSQSAVSDFKEYTVLEPLEFAGYYGFTEAEVRRLCEKAGLPFENARYWYDGYVFGQTRSIYNPFSMMSAVRTKRFKSFWKKTSAAETLITYIDMDMEGLQDDIARLIAGERIVVDTSTFQNDVRSFSSKDDVLTLLIHLGYLTCEEEYDDDTAESSELIHIPNEEVRSEFERILRSTRHSKLLALIARSDQLLKDTLEGNSVKVAQAIQNVHDSAYASTFYNNEQSLRYVVKIAYISCIDQFARVEELPSGHGIADVVFLPKKRSSLPAILVELKWNKEAEGAIQQIKERRYAKGIAQFENNLLLVGISCDARTKEHHCVIEKA